MFSCDLNELDDLVCLSCLATFVGPPTSPNLECPACGQADVTTFDETSCEDG